MVIAIVYKKHLSWRLIIIYITRHAFTWRPAMDAQPLLPTYMPNLAANPVRVHLQKTLRVPTPKDRLN